jgi:hypothetical protein
MGINKEALHCYLLSFTVSPLSQTVGTGIMAAKYPSTTANPKASEVALTRVLLARSLCSEKSRANENVPDDLRSAPFAFSYIFSSRLHAHLFVHRLMHGSITVLTRAK